MSEKNATGKHIQYHFLMRGRIFNCSFKALPLASFTPTSPSTVPPPPRKKSQMTSTDPLASQSCRVRRRLGKEMEAEVSQSLPPSAA